MEVFRLSRLMYANSLSGRGAAIKGARWNSPGVEMIYTAANRSLAMAEVLVHFSLATLPPDFMMMTINIPAGIAVTSVDQSLLSADWNAFPHTVATQLVGDKFILEGKSCVLKVPSAVTRGDFNFLINPHHKLFEKIAIVHSEAFPFDRRIFKQ